MGIDFRHALCNNNGYNQHNNGSLTIEYGVIGIERYTMHNTKVLITGDLILSAQELIAETVPNVNPKELMVIFDANEETIEIQHTTGEIVCNVCYLDAP